MGSKFKFSKLQIGMELVVCKYMKIKNFYNYNGFFNGINQVGKRPTSSEPSTLSAVFLGNLASLVNCLAIKFSKSLPKKIMLIIKILTHDPKTTPKKFCVLYIQWF
jgi:hypothetical protein